MKKKIIYIFLILTSFKGIAQTFNEKQQHQLDSLNTIINNPISHDTSLASAYVGLSEILYILNVDTIKPLCIKAKAIAEKALAKNPPDPVRKSLLKSLALSLGNIGYSYSIHGYTPEALKYYHQSLKIQKEIGDKKDIGVSLNNIGMIYKRMGKIDKALYYYFKSLKIREEIGDREGVAAALNNIGGIYVVHKEIPKALKYYHKSLEILKEIGYKKGMGVTLNNIGNTYKKLGDIPKALEYNHRSLKISEEIGDKIGIGVTLNNIGKIYLEKEEPNKALIYYYKSLNIQEEVDDKEHLSTTLSSIGDIMLRKGNLQQAQNYSQRSLKLAQEIGSPENINSAANLLSQIYEKQHKGMKALEMHKLYTVMRDSINNEAAQKAIAQQQAKYTYEKQKTIDDAAHDKQLAIEKEEKEKQKIIIIATGLGLALVVVFLLFVFNRLRIIKTQKGIIEEQHGELSAKNIQITDSIDYAKRIQQGMFPSKEKILDIFNQVCIYHNPKDIVSGDFYWAFQKDNKKYLAVVDCTGHGVPGAFMTIIGINILNQIMEKDEVNAPHKIIQALNTRLRELLYSEGNSRDGMDIGLICIEGNILQFAGTHISCYLTSEGVVKELKGQNGFIGYSDRLELETKTSNLDNIDMVYMFTDGFPDQKGGEKGKKYYYQPLVDLLDKIAKEKMSVQHNKLKESYSSWKGNLKQIDDVLVVGIRVETTL